MIPVSLCSRDDGAAGDNPTELMVNAMPGFNQPIYSDGGVSTSQTSRGATCPRPADQSTALCRYFIDAKADSTEERSQDRCHSRPILNMPTSGAGVLHD
jgi:hypothetical protein